MSCGWVYILTNKAHGTLYVGVTSDLVRRVDEHKTSAVPGFTKTYAVHHPVYFETFDTPAAAIQREKTIKGWPRQWKINKIEETNPEWRDLYDEIVR